MTQKVHKNCITQGKCSIFVANMKNTQILWVRDGVKSKIFSNPTIGWAENGLSEGDLLEGDLAYRCPPPCACMGEGKRRRRFCPYTQDDGRPFSWPLPPKIPPFSSGRRLEAKRTTRHNTSFALDSKFIKSRAPAVYSVSSVAGGGGGGGACHQSARPM